MNSLSTKRGNWFQEAVEEEEEAAEESIWCSSPVSSIGSHSDLEDNNEEEDTSPSERRHHVYNDPLHDMSSLLRGLPSKKGLSKYYKGKAQSFTSLTEVKSVEELAKPENPYATMRRLKPCKSYALMPSDNNQPPRHSCGALSTSNRNDEGFGNRPPIPNPHHPRHREVLG